MSGSGLSQFNITTYAAATESMRRHRDLMYGDASELFERIQITHADWHKPLEDETALICLAGIVANCIGHGRKALITLNRDTSDLGQPYG